MPNQYSFVTHWRVKAPVSQVWHEIFSSLEWPHWWRGVVAVTETLAGDERGIGSIRVYKMKSPMVYALEFNMLLIDRIEYALLKAIASGELAGSGEWHFEQEGAYTHVKCYWNVSPTLWWMKLFGFLLKPAFVYNHNVVMKNGAESLAKRLNTEVIIMA